MILLFIGPSGSGKDTQAEFLTQQYGFKRVSTGELIRGIANGESEMQQRLKSAMNDGFLEDEFVYGLLHIFFKYDKAPNYILSGVVRRESQVDMLEETLQRSGVTLDKVLYFDLSDEEAIKRMSGRLFCPTCQANYHLIFNPPKNNTTCDKCGTVLQRREDDNPESIRNRLAEFHKENDKILKRYEEMGKLIKIDATPSIEEIHKVVLNKLGL